MDARGDDKRTSGSLVMLGQVGELEGSKRSKGVALEIDVGDDDELEVEDWCAEWIGERVGPCRPARSLPACLMNRTGAKSEAGCNMSFADVRGASELVTYQRSEAAVIPETRCMSGMRLDILSDGSMFKEMHGPARGVRRRMMQSWEMCGGVCPEMDPANGCVSQSLARAWALRVLVVRLQFLHWDSEQMRRSDVEPKGQESRVEPLSDW